MWALTLHPEWAWAILNLDKRVENRRWPPPPVLTAKRFLLHAGAHLGGRPGDRSAHDGTERMLRATSCAGWRVVRISGRVRPYRLVAHLYSERHRGNVPAVLDTDEIVRGAIVGSAVLDGCTTVILSTPTIRPWAESGCYVWLLSGVAHVLPPIPAKGRQRFWRFNENAYEMLSRICFS